MKENIKKIFEIENRTKYFSHVLVYFFVISVAVFSLIIIGTKSLEKKEKLSASQKENPFAQITIDAKSALVWDVVNQRELFSKSSDKPLPLASLTKLMTAVVTENNLKNYKEVQITPEDLGPAGDSKLLVGDVWQARDLRDFTLLTSSNDGAFALAAITGPEESSHNSFIKDMNEMAEKIGLLNSKFFNEHGLDIDKNKSGAYGSALDMALLFEYTLKNHPEVLEVTRYKNMEFKSNAGTYSAQNTNIIVDKIPNIIASKTGFTDLAGGNLIVAFDAGLGRPIIVTVLGSTEEGRFSDVLKLTEATLKYISN